MTITELRKKLLVYIAREQRYLLNARVRRDEHDQAYYNARLVAYEDLMTLTAKKQAKRTRAA